MGSIFNPGEAHMKEHLAAEKILPAPSPTADDPPLHTEDGDEVYIPRLDSISATFEPNHAALPTPVRAAHKPDGSPITD